MAAHCRDTRARARCITDWKDLDLGSTGAEPLANQQAAGYLAAEGDEVRLTRKGLLQADSLLPEYFEEEHKAVRYT